MIGRVFVF